MLVCAIPWLEKIVPTDQRPPFNSMFEQAKVNCVEFARNLKQILATKREKQKAALAASSTNMPNTASTHSSKSHATGHNPSTKPNPE